MSALLVAGIVLLKNAPEIVARTQRLYWARRCAAHITPPGTVLIETDPAKAAQLIANNRDYVADGTQMSSFRGMGPPTTAVAGSVAVYWPREFRQFARAMPPPPFVFLPTKAVAFMGERISPSGHRRLVVIPVAAIYSDELEFDADIERLCIVANADLSNAGTAVWSKEQNLMRMGFVHPMNLLLKPGVADPADASHITIDFDGSVDWSPIKGTLDVYLRDDDSIDVQWRRP
ncbi:MAG TPA: hypothetical protein VH370_26965 [Humisphaera sp.]|nr:hypothetical protein [Humisphaera sp.]